MNPLIDFYYDIIEITYDYEYECLCLDGFVGVDCEMSKFDLNFVSVTGYLLGPRKLSLWLVRLQ